MDYFPTDLFKSILAYKAFANGSISVHGYTEEWLPTTACTGWPGKGPVHGGREWLGQGLAARGRPSEDTNWGNRPIVNVATCTQCLKSLHCAVSRRMQFVFKMYCACMPFLALLTCQWAKLIPQPNIRRPSICLLAWVVTEVTDPRGPISDLWKPWMITTRHTKNKDTLSQFLDFVGQSWIFPF